MHRSWQGYVVALLGLGAIQLRTETAFAGKLAQLRERTGASGDNSNHDSNDDDDDDDDGDSCGWLQILLGCGSSEPDDEPVPIAIEPVDPDMRRQQLSADDHFFLPYPYALGNPGNSVTLRLPTAFEFSDCSPDDAECMAAQHVGLCIDGLCLRPPVEETWSLPPGRRKLQTGRMQLFGDVGQDTDGLKRGTLGATVDSNGLFGGDTRWTYWLEKTPEGEVDDLWVGDINLRIEAIKLPELQVAFGIGPRLLLHSEEGRNIAESSSAGVNVTAAAELYPLRPFVFRTEFDVGNLGPAGFWEAQVNLGVIVQRLELYVGAARFRVAELKFDSAFAGLRVHL
jgi:hypothetical protein